jgi:hypothetical protein
MSSHKDWRISVNRPESLDLRGDGALGEVPGSHEAVVYLAATAFGVVNLIDAEVDDPVLSVRGASEGQHDASEGIRVAGETLKVSDRVAEALDVLEGEAMAEGAGPGIDAGDGLVCDRRQVGKLSGNLGLIGRLGDAYQGQHEEQS